MSECPLCNETNNCAIAHGNKPETCWCMNVTIAPQLLEKAAPESNTCICQTCVDEWYEKGRF
ncbi:cysteine-rich CWC family protein [Fictibacillus sp. UD]|uniref:cysteine-rich CWC family protein n=1 Tax=Fictibacillus sp. UD TaxID=3038777 RepID=UPI00374689D9